MKNGVSTATVSKVINPAHQLSPDTALWPAYTVQRRPIGDLKPFARNARQHSPQQIAEIAASIREWGWTMPVLIDETGMILAGHARVLAAQSMKLDEVPVVVAADWTDAQKRAYVLADNKLGLNSTWDEKLLALEVADLTGMGFDLGVAGFSADDLATLDDLVGGDQGTPSDGSLLALLDITIAEPKHAVARGDVWRLGEHVLHCCSVTSGWQSWASELRGDKTLFCPYAGPMVPLSDKALTHKLVVVQPDPYIAGHILDRYCEVNGKKSVKRTISGAA